MKIRIECKSKNMIDGINDLIKRAEEIKQNYEKIIKQCNETGEKFVDHYFNESEYNNSDITLERLEEHYGTDIFSNISENGVVQLELSDCFLISSLTQVARYPDLVKQLFYKPHLETGCCCCKFTCMGKPFYVIIDTIVPFKYGKPNHSYPRNKNDSYWFCLVEKAYAKIMGGYSKIDGSAKDAFFTLFGWPSKFYRLNEFKDPIKELLSFSKKSEWIFTSTPDANLNGQKEFIPGIVKNHSYAFWEIVKVNGNIYVHLRNPHGTNNFKGKYTADQFGYNNESHLYIPVDTYLKYFNSFTVVYPLNNPNMIYQSFEYDILPEDDCKFPSGHGPYAGTLNQYLVSLQPSTEFNIFICISDGASKVGFVLHQNNGEKLFYKSWDKIQHKYKLESHSLLYTGRTNRNSDPYTLCVSRYNKVGRRAHLYCIIWSEKKFNIKEIKFQDFNTLNRVQFRGTLKAGEFDGRSIYGWNSISPLPQWRLKVPSRCRIFFRVFKERTKADHVLFFYGKQNILTKSEKIERNVDYKREFLIAKDKNWEEFYIDIDEPNWSYVCGVRREAEDIDTKFKAFLYSTKQITIEKLPGIEDIPENMQKRIVIKGTLRPNEYDGNHAYKNGGGVIYFRQYKLTFDHPQRVFIETRHAKNVQCNLVIVKYDHPFNLVQTTMEDKKFFCPWSSDRHLFEADKGIYTFVFYREEASKDNSPYKITFISDDYFMFERYNNELKYGTSDPNEGLKFEKKQIQKINEYCLSKNTSSMNDDRTMVEKITEKLLILMKE